MGGRGTDAALELALRERRLPEHHLDEADLLPDLELGLGEDVVRPLVEGSVTILV